MFVLAVDTSTPQVTAGLVRVAELPGAALSIGRVAPILEEVATAGHVDARAHNEVLTPLIRRCLDEAGLKGTAASSIGAVVVGCGPGPFTGLRVGMATAASFADAWGVPAHGACSLDALAHPGGEPLAGDVMAVTDARRREVYAAAYRDGERIWGPAVLAASACAGTVAEDVPDFAPAHFIGDEGKCADVAASFAERAATGDATPSGVTPGDVTPGGSAPTITAAYPTVAGLVAAAIVELERDHDGDAAEPFRATAALAAPASPLVPLYLRRPDATPPKAKPKSPAIPDVPADVVAKRTAETP